MTVRLGIVTGPSAERGGKLHRMWLGHGGQWLSYCADQRVLATVEMAAPSSLLCRRCFSEGAR
jgi:hypothetical protein